MTWLPYHLHPEYPPEGMPRSELRRRYGENHEDHLRRFFADRALDFDPPEVMPRSLNALRVTELARDRGLHEQVHDRLMDALWSERSDLRDDAVLTDLAVEVGLERADIERVLAGDEYADRVEASTRQAVSIGITGIPGFLLGGRLLVLGAQPEEVFERGFAQLGEDAAGDPIGTP